MIDPTNATPGIGAGLSNAIASTPAPAASPAPASSPAPQEAPRSTAENNNWYARTDVSPGETSGTFSPGNGSDQPQGDQIAQGDPGLHGEPPSPLQQALPPREYTEFKLPEGYQGQLDPKTVRDFTQIFDAGRGNDHQVSAQRLIDMHLAEIQKVGEQALRHQRHVWDRTIEARINEVKADPVLGGNNLPITLGNAKFALQQHLGLAPAEVQELLAVMDNGGVSSHRLMLKALNHIYERNREPGPIDGQNPATSKLMQQSAGGRSWYDTVDNPGQSR
jgi:hypothetical protein